MVRAERDRPADDDDVDEELSGGEFEIEGALRAAGEREDDEAHDEEDADSVDRSGEEWMLDQEWQAQCGDDVDSRDGERDEVVQCEAERDSGAAGLEGTRAEEPAGDSFPDTRDGNVKRGG